MANWIQGAIINKGAFRKQAKEAGESTGEYSKDVLSKGSHASETTKKRARLAQTLSKLRKKRHG